MLPIKYVPSIHCLISTLYCDRRQMEEEFKALLTELMFHLEDSQLMYHYVVN